ncbi:hypothetical protein DFR29_1247 [Tahibacter aquaticus]|uniref:Uncharacterized protein n=1 Tax=Tahibacter aquaticus TaxID=520092 RepID=A0A4R6YKT2_9GAMM|nr:hypothetical protein DFR29_1247 [Tahibacter aquaticus]
MLTNSHRDFLVLADIFSTAPCAGGGPEVKRLDRLAEPARRYLEVVAAQARAAMGHRLRTPAMRTLAAGAVLPHATAMRHARLSLVWRGLLWRSLLSLMLVLTGTMGASGRSSALGAPSPRAAHACHGAEEAPRPQSPAPFAPCCMDHVCHCGCLPMAALALVLRLHAPEPELTDSSDAPAWPLDRRPIELLRPPNPAGI